MCISSFYSVPAILDIDLPTLQHPVDVTRHRQERLLDVLAGPCRRFQELCVVEFGKMAALLRGDGAFGDAVRLVADDSVNGALRLNMELRLRQPALEVLETASIGYVVHKQNADGVPVVRLRD